MQNSIDKTANTERPVRRVSSHVFSMRQYRNKAKNNVLITAFTFLNFLVTNRLKGIMAKDVITAIYP